METVKHKVVSMQGKEVSSIDLDPVVFGAKVDKTLVHATVRWQLAKRRAGTHQALTRSMMKGGGKKPWRQKGTGRARAGSIISPLWVGGASIHGPLPRSYEHRLSKRARRQALAAVLTDKLLSNQLVIVDSLAVPSGKTKEMVSSLEKLGVGSSKAVVVLSGATTRADATTRSVRNISRITPLTPRGVNVYDLMKSSFLICSVDAITELQKRVKGELTESVVATEDTKPAVKAAKKAAPKAKSTAKKA